MDWLRPALPVVVLAVDDFLVMQMLHPSDSLSGGAISDGYFCAWLNSLPSCTVIVIAQVMNATSLTRMIAGADMPLSLLLRRSDV